MNYDAIFSDGTSQFRNPAEPRKNDTVTISIRVAAYEAAHISLVFQKTNGLKHKVTMQWNSSRSDNQFDYYSAEIQTDTAEHIHYYFMIKTEKENIYYDRMGVSSFLRDEYRFCITPGFTTPEWAKGAVMYQIFVDRFYDGDDTNDVLDDEYFYIQERVKTSQDWDKPPALFGVGEFYGGDIEGVRQKLNYLKSMGVEVIYFNPIFVSPSNHKYDIADYDYIDPHYGKIVKDQGHLLSGTDHINNHATRFKCRVTDKENLEASNAFFASFVEQAHSMGIKIILDGVFNHCGSFNKWLDREEIYDESYNYPPGAFRSKDSPYRDFFSFSDMEGWPSNGSYQGWWGHDTLPKLNYEGSQELYDYVMKVAQKWVSPPYNVDGWRLDVAADLGHSEQLNHRFWRDFRRVVKNANPNAVILAEHYGDPSAWMDGFQWDTIMNYDAFMEPLSYFLTGMEKHSDAFDPGALGDGERFKNTMLHFMSRMQTSSLYCSMNQLSNHDHSRFLTRTNHMAGRVSELGYEAAGENVSIPIMKEAIMVQMTWPGAPTLYYGDEAGQVGFTDPDNRRTFPWDNINEELTDFYRDMIGIHKSYEALRSGSFIFLDCGLDYISYGRFVDHEQIVVVINISDKDRELSIPVWRANVPMVGQMSQLMSNKEETYSMYPQTVQVEKGMLKLEMSPVSGMVLRSQY